MTYAKKQLVLGTALWGYSVEENIAFTLLDSFYEKGFRWLDTATNYPIDKNPEHFRLAEQIIARWLRHRKVNDLKIIVKIGSVSNDGSPTNDLSPNFIRRCQVHYRDLFGSNLDSLWLHWDNRDSAEEIQATLDALNDQRSRSLIGLSGIRYPEIYADLAQKMDLHFRIQIKHNLLSSALAHYQALASRAIFFVYGINAGGFSLDTTPLSDKNSIRLRQINPKPFDLLRPQFEKLILHSQKTGHFPVQSFNQLSMTYAFGTPLVHGLIIGPSKLAQLEESMAFFEQLTTEDYEDLYACILKNSCLTE